MKKIAITLCLVLVLGGLIIFGLLNNPTNQNSEYLRIHIRANSNSEIDQAVKYQVKDAVVEALIPILSSCQTKQEAEQTLQKNFSLI